MSNRPSTHAESGLEQTNEENSMAICPFAKFMPITGTSGAYNGGPFKIVHHTTEGGKAKSAFEAFSANRSDPHFTVDAEQIWQHIDTGTAARALRNDRRQAPETNRDGAIQIEVVGFAHLPKGKATLMNVARLCRWIEQTHGVPRNWPNGHPKPAVNGRDPGGHNRDITTWEKQGGHYGHCHVPENTHWDPGYTEEEIHFLALASSDEEFVPGLESVALPEPDLTGAESTMPSHAETDGNE